MRTKPIPYNDIAPGFNHPAKSIGAAPGLGRRAGAWFLHELREILPPTIFVFRDAVLPGRAAAWTPDHRIDLHCRCRLRRFGNVSDR
jgi:hypothetical protein